GTSHSCGLSAAEWFSGLLGSSGPKPLYGDYVGVLAQVEATLDNGDVVRLDSDGEWTAESTPFLLADIYDGETFDARLTEAEPATIEVLDESIYAPSLVAPKVPPVRRIETVQPAKTTVVDTQTLQIDFG